MDWYKVAEQDYEVYQDKARIKNFVVNGKITEAEYAQITGETYTAPA